MKNNYLRYISRRLSDLPLRRKLLITYFVLVIMPLAVFTGYAFFRINQVIQAQTFTAAQKTFEESCSRTEELFRNSENVLDSLVMDRLVYEMASSPPGGEEAVTQMVNTFRLSETFRKLKQMSGIDGLRIYVKSGFLYSEQNTDIFSIQSIENTGWYRRMMASDDKMLWFFPWELPPDDGAFSFMRIIYDPDSIEKPLAVLRADINPQRLLEIISAYPITDNSITFLADRNRILLSSGHPSGQTADTLLSGITEARDDEWTLYEAEGRNSYIRPHTFPLNGLRLITLIPCDDIYRVSRQLRAGMLVTVMVVAAAAYALAYFVSQSTLRRISMLSDTMAAVEKGDITVRLIPQGGDEIGKLMGSFGRMMDHLSVLMDEKVRDGKRIKSLELKALQAQINPHFLYNSLDLINCTAISSHVPRISKMVSALARFYKLSLSRGRERIPLSDEFLHAKLYIDIQNMRFENRITVVWDIDRQTLPCMVVKIILQPVIENAIIHGIFEKPEKAGVLTVRSVRTGEDILITVADDGVGMDGDTVYRNFDDSAPAAPENSGYGIRNIIERLHIAYGPDYGLACQSIPGQGTTVTIRIPAECGKEV